jgi:hypothetical protein
LFAQASHESIRRLNAVFIPAIRLAEIIVRGSLMYLGLFVILRWVALKNTTAPSAKIPIANGRDAVTTSADPIRKNPASGEARETFVNVAMVWKPSSAWQRKAGAVKKRETCQDECQAEQSPGRWAEHALKRNECAALRGATLLLLWLRPDFLHRTGFDDTARAPSEGRC